MKIALDKEQFKRIVRSKVVIIVAAIFVFYSLFGFFLVPLLIRHYLPRTIQNTLHTQATVGKVRFNPYLFKLDMRTFSMQGADGKPIIAFDRFFADWELKSLFKWAWLFREVRLEAPMVNAEIQKEGGLNLAHLKSPSATPAPAKDQTPGQPPRLIFENIQIIKGKLVFIDQRPSKPATITLAPLDAAFINLATLPDRESGTTLTAQSEHHETLKWEGQISLNPVTIKGRLELKDILSATLASFAGDHLNLAPPAGTLSAESDCLIDLRKASQIVFSKLSLSMKDIALALADAPATPVLSLPDAHLNGARLDLTGHSIDLGKIAVKGGGTQVTVNEQGVLNLQRVTGPSRKDAENAKPATEKKTGTAWSFKIDGFDIERFGALYEDRRHAPGFKGAIGEIKGHLAAESGAHQAWTIKDAMLRAADLKIGFADAEPTVHINSVALEKGNADLDKKQLKAARIAVEGGALQIERRADGTLNLAQLFAPPQTKPKADGPPSDAAAVKPPEGADAKPDQPAPAPPDAVANKPHEKAAFQFAVDRISLSGLKASFLDRTINKDQPNKDQPILNVEDFSAAADKVDGRSPMPVEVALSLREGGQLKATGTIDPAAGSLAAQIDLNALALPPFQGYVAPVAAAIVKSGSFSTKGTLRHGIKDAGAGTVYEGGFKLENLQVVETDLDETVIGWKSASTEQLKFLLQPDTLEIGDLRVDGLAGKAIIEKDSSFNMANLIKKKPDQPRPSETAKPQPRETTPFAYRVRRVLINDGRVTFSDRRLLIPFATNIHELRGNVAGISSVNDARSELRLRGQVDEFGTARAEGELNTSNPKKMTDIKLIFRNVEMSKLTPYSGQFAGRKIDAGKLSVDLAYQVDNGQLKGNNKIVVEQLKLGDKIKSPDAVDLPLDLAVALLKDSKGVINLGLPVQGDLNNPQFSLSGLFGKTLLNVLTKVATSPFRALGALIPGGGEQTLDRVAFDPGRSNVPPPEQEKLLKLAEAMRQRPQLKLVVQGRYHPENDRKALARRSLRKTVTMKLGQSVSDESPNPLDFSSSETQDVLEDMFKERFGKDALKALEAESKEARKQAKASDPGFWSKELFNRLLTAEPVPDDQLIELANARAKAVIAELGRQQGLSPERLAAGEPVALKASEEITVALSMETIKQ